MAFIPEQVNVIYGSSSMAETRSSYDPECSSSDGWCYDDPAAPATIVLSSARVRERNVTPRRA